MLKNEFCVLSDNELESVSGGCLGVGKFMKDTANAMWQVPVYAVYPTKAALEDQGSGDKGFFKDRKYAVKKAMHFEGDDVSTSGKVAGVTGVALDGMLVAATIGVSAFFGVKKFRKK